ncbi:glycosyltransferase [Natrinema altunense]|uniref:Hexosyltransferase n=1 Tax=Natrinema altunense (strain JCM 12890 / CGMCC 1.3731 / AJ2) TaxID=1227494 RepID=L9ZKN7_NATA2|nr:glycosyltransferase [Natrinema altunense]ELY87075.1 hexosyltransferase [Natrinema altunense JCM 12890]
MEELGVLYYVDSFPKLSETFILNEIYELYQRGYNVAVFAQNNPEEDISHTEYRGINIPVYYVDTSCTSLHQLFSKKSIQMAKNTPISSVFSNLSLKQSTYNFFLGNECRKFIDSLDFDIDIIHAHFASTTRIGGLLAARYHDIPCTVTAHAVEIFKNPNPDEIKFICDSMNHVIVPSKYNYRYLRDEIGIDNDITVVPATTRIEKFEPSASPVKNRLLTVARLVEKKGCSYGIEAINDLVEKGYNLEYHIIGTGDREDLLRQQVQKYGIGDHVKFLGNVSDETLQKELNDASIFLLPCVIADDGDRDAMPVVLKEAMASETACVSTTVSAIPELITDGHDGLLVPQKQSEELAAAIRQLLDKPQQRRRIAENGRKTVHNKFDISGSVDTLTEIFNSVQV